MLQKSTTFAVIAAAGFIGGCAHTQPQPVSEPETVYLQAAAMPPPVYQPAVVTVTTPVPMPGQLKGVPRSELQAMEREKRQASGKPWEVIDKANEESRQNPNRYGYFNSIMQYDYEPGSLFQVYAAPLRLTNIMLQPGEKVIGKPAAGDTVRWVLGLGQSKYKGQDQVHIYLKPTRPDLHTTLSINTDRRSYHLEIHSFKETYMAAVSWRYPQDEIAVLQQQAAAQQAETAKVTSSRVQLDDLNFDYTVETYKGERPAWLPVKVFDDGRKTFVQFPPEMLNREAPTLFILTAKGETQLVNYRVKNEYYVVDRLFDRAELRVGQKQQTIVRIAREVAEQKPAYRQNSARR